MVSFETPGLGREEYLFILSKVISYLALDKVGSLSPNTTFQSAYQ